MKPIVAAAALLLVCAGVAAASEATIVRDPSPAAVISQFAQAIPPEPPVVGELPGQARPAMGAACCMKGGHSMKGGHKTAAQKAGDGARCGCCRMHQPASNATKK